MVLGDVDRTRRLAGNPSTTNVTNVDITSYLEYATSMVLGKTGFDFEANQTNSNYESAVMAAEYFASSAIRDRFGDQANISTEHYDRAISILEGVTANLIASGQGGAGAGGGGSKGASTQYRTFPKNPNALIYRSTSPTSGYLGEDVSGPRA